MTVIVETLARLLVEGYSEAKSEFAQITPKEIVDATISAYQELVNRNQVQGNERNIDWWRKQGWDKFAQFVKVKSTIPSGRQEKRSKNTGQSVILEETEEWLIVIPLDKNASCFHGKYTDWCTAKPYAGHFETYMHDSEVTLVYCLRSSGEKWAIVIYPDHDIHLFDKNDNQITAEQFTRATGLNANKYIQMAFADAHNDQVVNARQSYLDLKEEIDERLYTISARSEELEHKMWIIKDIGQMLHYCVKLNYRWNKLERLLIGATII